MSYITTLLDRIHAINQTIVHDKLNCYRVFQPNILRAPYIVPMLIGNTTYEQFGAPQYGSKATITERRELGLVVVVAPLATDVAVQTAHEAAETLIPLIVTKYAQKPYLQLNDNGLADLDYARITSDTGIDVNPRVEKMLSIVFTLEVQFKREF